MKKIIGFLMILFLGFFFLNPTKVFALLDDYTPQEWYNHITQFDKGYAWGIIYHEDRWGDDKFVISIIEEPSGDFLLDDVVYGLEDLNYFEPQLHDVILHWASNDFYDGYYGRDEDEFFPALENTLGQTNYCGGGRLYWNFEEQYWQIDYYNSADFIEDDFIEDEEFTFYYQFTEFTESGNPEMIRIYFTYPIIVLEDTEIPIEIWFYRAGSATDTIESISFFDQQFDVYLTEGEKITVNYFVDSSYDSDKIRLTFLEYTYRGTLKTKNITVDMPVFVYASEEDYYEYQIAILNEKIQELQNQLDLEFDRGYLKGYGEGYDFGHNVGYDEGLRANNEEAYQEGFRDGEKSKLAEKNEAFYKGLEKWLVPAIIAVILLGGFVTIAVRKRREE